MIKHKKHTNLARRYNDNFAPNEISFLGTNCGNISDLVTKISRKLSKYKLAYFDASHAKDVEENSLSEFVFHYEGNVQITTSGNLNKFEQRLQFAQYDYVFINGNHYQGAKQILILDEATSALDSATEKLVQSAIKNIHKDRTKIIIAHRLSTIQDADRIIVLKDGQIIEQGSHKELLTLSGEYAKLNEQQFS